MISKEDIIELSNIHPLRVKNIYTFGSRLHGTNNLDSDYDYFLVASTLNEHKEIKATNKNNLKLNIHVITLDKFKSDLNQYKMSRIESIMAPIDFIIMEKEPIAFSFKKDKIKKSIKYQSYESWSIAKSRINNEDDSYRAKKSAFHSLRMLDYGIQILEFNKIVDFGSMNHIYEKIKSPKIKNWDDIKKEFFSYKIELEKKLEKY